MRREKQQDNSRLHTGKVMFHRMELILPLLFFFFAASFGLILRLMALYVVPATYKFLLHGHSHIAMLGWMYFAVIYLLKHYFISKPKQERQYRLNFRVTALSVFGMLISFPFTGYALVSIVSSSLFIFGTYHFCYLFFRDLKRSEVSESAKKLAKYGLVFLIISSIGPWSLAGIMASGNSGSVLYKNAIYFYLHFMYNGFLIFSLLALLANALSPYISNLGKQRKAIAILVFTGLTTVLLSFLWNIDNQFVNFVGLLLGLFQFYGFYIFMQSFDTKQLRTKLRQQGQVFQVVIWVIFCSFVAKLILQILSSCPWIIGEAIQNRDFVIGYVHLVFLGIISLFLFVILFHKTRETMGFKLGSFLYLIGFFGTEFMLLFRGSGFLIQKSSLYAELLVVFSVFLVLALLVYLFLGIKNAKKILEKENGSHEDNAYDSNKYNQIGDY